MIRNYQWTEREEGHARVAKESARGSKWWRFQKWHRIVNRENKKLYEYRCPHFNSNHVPAGIHQRGGNSTGIMMNRISFLPIFIRIQRVRVTFHLLYCRIIGKSCQFSNLDRVQYGYIYAVHST